MKLKKFLMGFGAIAALSLASCSNDEPNTPTPDQPAGGEGSTMYLNINITDANSARSRADEDGDKYYKENGEEPTNPSEGDYAFGNADEHKVERADFLFYDKDGKFVTRANVWQGVENSNKPNVEYMGNNTLVLRNLTENNLPVYLITVLNAPASLSEKVQNETWTMDRTRKELMSITNDTGNFIMSTTSFIPGSDSDKDRYDYNATNKTGYYYATKLKSGDFMKEIPTTNQVSANAVKIYVERLAAKFTLTGLNSENEFEVKVSIAGLVNGVNGNVTSGEGDTEVSYPSASESVYVKILGYGLTAQEKDSYLSKNIDDFNSSSFSDWTWNHHSFYRSYWAKSPSYGNANPTLTYSQYADAQVSLSKPLYGYETTNTADNLKSSTSNNALVPSKTTNMLITAKVYGKDKEGKETNLDLVEFNGFYFTKDQYIKYVLSNTTLSYWKNEEVASTSTSTSTNEGGETVETTITKYKYSGLESSDFTWAKKEDGATGEIVIVANIGDDAKLYTKREGWNEGDRMTEVSNKEAAIKAINTSLASFNEQIKATAFNGGHMYYSVPIEHLLGSNKSAATVEKEGEYGVVRNHWYQIQVNKLITLGHGVFNPGDAEAEDKGEVIIPDDPKKERFALAAQINILSWKIVQQTVDL